MEPLFKETKIMATNEIIKSESCVLALHDINQCLPFSLKFTDLHNYSTQNSANHQLPLPQVKTTNYGLHSIRYKTAKHWNSMKNSSNLNFANNFVSSENSLKYSRKMFTRITQQSYDLFKGIQLTL